jgi:hypothetical protein
MCYAYISHAKTFKKDNENNLTNISHLITGVNNSGDKTSCLNIEYAHKNSRRL